MLKLSTALCIAASSAVVLLAGQNQFDSVDRDAAAEIHGSQCTVAIPAMCGVPGYACTMERGGKFLARYPGIFDPGQTDCNVDMIDGDGHDGCGHYHVRLCDGGDPIEI